MRCGRRQGGAERPVEVAADERVHALDDGRIETVAVAEVAVEDGLRGARGGRDLLHADRVAVLADRPQGGLDELGSPGEIVLGPARGAMAHQTEAMERKIMARAEALLADIEGKIKSEWAAGIANDKAQLRYTDMLEERGRLLQVIAQARQVQAL
mgnify:CR=1 FL=1